MNPSETSICLTSECLINPKCFSDSKNTMLHVKNRCNIVSIEELTDKLRNTSFPKSQIYNDDIIQNDMEEIDRWN
jgi:hypothetical protein